MTGEKNAAKEIADRQTLMALQEIENQCYDLAMYELKSGNRGRVGPVDNPQRIEANEAALQAAMGWVVNYGIQYERLMKNVG